MYWNEADGVKVGVLNDGLTSLSNVKHCFGVNTHPESWITETVQEAPHVVVHNKKIYILFSGNSTGPKYGIGAAICQHPFNGPFTKLKGNPLLQMNGSGHCAVTKDHKGDFIIAFHMHQGNTRNMHLGRLTFDGLGTPSISRF